MVTLAPTDSPQEITHQSPDANATGDIFAGRKKTWPVPKRSQSLLVNRLCATPKP